MQCVDLVPLWKRRVVPSLDRFSFVANKDLVYCFYLGCLFMLFDLFLVKAFVLIVLKKFTLQNISLFLGFYDLITLF